jgi:hypothetical protein
MDQPRALLTLAGHMHARALALTVTLDGVPIYQQTDWQHPQQRLYAPPWDVTGHHLAVSCLYDNGVTRPVHACAGIPCALPWGLLADDAMCLAAGYAVTP